MLTKTCTFYLTIVELQFDAKYELVAFMGTEADKAVVLQQRAGSIELKTAADSTPKPAYVHVIFFLSFFLSFFLFFFWMCVVCVFIM